MTPPRRYHYRLRKLARMIHCSIARRFPALDMAPRTATPLAAECIQCHDIPSAELMVFLPGIADLPEDFEVSGFIASLQSRATAADVVVADLHFGYYVRRSALERLRQDVIVPARLQGYTTIGLVGVSLGGLGALLYAMEHGADIDGVVLVAPYLGESALIQEIQNAGGVRRWTPGEVGTQDFARGLWRWLKERYAGGSVDASPPLYLAYGESDCFAPGNRLLAEVLPQDRVFTVDGGHDWRTWKRLWLAFLAQRDTRV